MTDIALLFDNMEWTFDAALSQGDLQSDAGLSTAIYISLFTDRRADASDAVPDGSGDRRGWWGDYAARVDGDLIGSRLWLLRRRTRTAEVLRLAKDYALEALQWLVDDGVAASVDVIVTSEGRSAIGLTVVVERPDGKNSRFNYVWETNG